MVQASNTKQAHSLVFCSECGFLLDPPAANEKSINCDACGHLINADVFESIEVVTNSSVKAFTERPKFYGMEDQDSDAVAHLKDGATIKEKCPKCDAPEMVFHTAQLRSADEGQTIFYSCIKCGYKYRVNS
ncbi:transcription factor S-II-domain-containing protein [Polychytrium aggregatum]|uniref:transcription factor S-II-domain-containing protein n=1 Tax=Polychytrium aggregatum TaxID=110093 RepID=UPI0022FDF060|nr:transcription factor S-II-domain-containing protein [Polychytrium aggregatum]KAI9206346.1 transcription factor S-II-domain-containing protein [Polychytrium aggregatum]